MNKCTRAYGSLSSRRDFIKRALLVSIATSIGLAPEFVRAADAHPPDLTLLNGVTKIRGTMTQIIGTFATYGPVHVGDAFELDLMNLPKEKIAFTSPNSASGAKASPYIPLESPLIITKVTKENGNAQVGYFGAGVYMSANHGPVDQGEFLVQIIPKRMQKGSESDILFFSKASGSVDGMAEASGVLF